MAIPSFVDRATLRVAAGNGGHGCASVHREKFKPLGGPDGGNGGNGGSVIIRVDPNLTTLVEYHRQSQRKASNGQPGRGCRSWSSCCPAGMPRAPSSSPFTTRGGRSSTTPCGASRRTAGRSGQR